MNAVTFSARLASDLIAYVESQGHDPSPLHEILALPEKLQQREDIRIPSPRMAELWLKAMDLADDRHVGLSMVLAQNLASLQTHSLLMQSSQTLKESIETGISYSALISNAMEIALGESDGLIHVDYKPSPLWSIEDEAVVFDLASSALYGMFAFTKNLLGPDVVPSMVWFESSSPREAERIDSAFPCPVSYDKPVNRIAYPQHVGSRTIPTRDQSLLEALQAYGDSIFSSSNFGGSMAQKTASVIAGILGEGSPSLQTVADRLHVSPRTLQRKIQEETGHSFRRLVDEVRIKSADKLLRDPARTVEEIGFLLGYADTASFLRAFKRWHGHSPRQGSPQE